MTFLNRKNTLKTLIYQWFLTIPELKDTKKYLSDSFKWLIPHKKFLLASERYFLENITLKC